MTNCRPLTLLNTDYKILAKILATRLNIVIHKLIKPVQTGFIRGQHISDNIVKLVNLVDHCKTKRIAAALISVDFEKAFDSVEWSALRKVMEKMGFAPLYTDAISTLYKDTQSAVLNNGFWSEWFPLSRSCRQGCPISPLLFDLVVEVLGCKIRTNKDIHGITINGVEEKEVQYAYDLWLFLLFAEENVNAALSELDQFEQFSGLKTNFQKSSIVRIGAIVALRMNTVQQLKWSNGLIKILGIQIHPDIDIMLELNYSPLLQKIRDIISMWRYRTMTVLGKIQVTNSLIAFQLTYKMLCLPTPPDHFFSAYKDIVMEFLWKDVSTRIAFDRLIKDFDDGGLKLIDLRSKGKALKFHEFNMLILIQQLLYIRCCL